MTLPAITHLCLVCGKCFHHTFNCCTRGKAVWEISHLAATLSTHGLAIVSEADRKVLEAMSVIPETLFKKRAARACPELDAAIQAEAEARKTRAK